tara:strand:+ start:113 stop:577 length:465 start_codon:yes stop_codon:yes gene_type:complete
MMRKLKLLILLISLISTAAHSAPKEIDWNDLIPWTAVFSPGEVKFNKSLVDKEVKIPGYVLPLDMFGRDINSFLLVPYIGACIHVPPPAPNQIVYVEAEVPWQGLAWWEPVYVTGKIKIENQNIEDLAIVGYEMSASDIEYYRGETGTHGFFDW